MTTDEVMKFLEANLQRYEKKHGVVADRELLVLKLMEEVGEFAQALVIYENKCRAKKRLDPQTAKENLSSELGDVLACVLAIASRMEIDVFEELERKALGKGRKFLETGEM